jgi:hypothetical protein
VDAAVAEAAALAEVAVVDVDAAEVVACRGALAASAEVDRFQLHRPTEIIMAGLDAIDPGLSLRPVAVRLSQSMSSFHAAALRDAQA